MRQKDIPRELLIRETLWSIVFIRVIEKDKECLGLCDPSISTIYIKQGQSFKERADTLAHELLHAICYEYDFEIKHKHIYKLAHSMAELFVNNF